jgi:hypothetical protein
MPTTSGRKLRAAPVPPFAINEQFAPLLVTRVTIAETLNGCGNVRAAVNKLVPPN